MPRCPGKNIRALILNGGMRANSRMTDVPYIKAHFASIMQAQRIRTVRSFLRYFENRSPAERYARITVLLQNPNGNQCGSKNYHIQDINRCAYTKLRQLLIQCRNQWRRLGLNERPNYPANPIPVHPRRTRNAKVCGCISNRRTCNGTPGCQAVRVGREYKCIPTGRTVGFAGVGRYSGQITRNRAPEADGDYQYVRVNIGNNQARYSRVPSRNTRRRRTLAESR